MHKSRLTGIVIDCKTEDLDAAAKFWGAALGHPIKDADEGDTYRELEVPKSSPQIMLQAVAHESRVHIDIESDNLDAEVARLEALGAKRIGFVRRWWVMEAPTGHRFCVVNPQRGPLDEHSNEWP